MNKKIEKLNKTEILDKLKEFDSEIQKASKVINLLFNERVEWSKENRESIKALYPKKGKIYQIKDPLRIFGTADRMYYEGNHRNCSNSRYKLTKDDDWGCYECNIDDIYFFKPTNTMFHPKRDFAEGWLGIYNNGRCGDKSKPSVEGIVLDCNLDVLKKYDEVRIYITDIIEVEEEKLSEEMKLEISGDCTKVYVMIDKNTGYYKIGRSRHPKYREKTLQSEKPTIEMLFNHKGRNKDETYLHNYFRTQRVRGEWFDLSGSDLNKIRRYFNNRSL